MTTLRETTPGTLSDQVFERLRALLRKETGIALGDNKRTLVQARLSTRLAELGLDSYDAYLRALEGGGVELGELINALTTNKTSFYREPHHFDALRERVEAMARASRGAPLRLRVWSAACSTGEEPYTIAMTLLDALPPGAHDVKILASDIDTEVLEKAARGVYSSESVAHDVPQRIAARWVVQGTGAEAGRARIRREARRLITFQQINLIAPSWPFRAKFDLVFCRNALIYFDRPTQDATVRRFVGLLAPGGELVLGHSESLLGFRAGLKPLGKTRFGAAEEAGRP